MPGYTVAVPRQRTGDETQRHRENVGDLVKRARKEARLSQEALGTLLGVTRQTIAEYESGTTSMLMDHLPVIVDELSIDPRAMATPPEKVRYARPLSDFLIPPAVAEQQAADARAAAASALEDLEAEEATGRAAAERRGAKRDKRPA